MLNRFHDYTVPAYYDFDPMAEKAPPCPADAPTEAAEGMEWHERVMGGVDRLTRFSWAKGLILLVSVLFIFSGAARWVVGLLTGGQP